VSEWLDLMIDEVARKQREQTAAKEELKRRAEPDKLRAPPPAKPAQSK
jgi:hypothetical protein